MENTWERRAIWFGLIFSGASLLVSVFAVFIAYRQITSPFQQQLYTKQIDVVIEIQKKGEDIYRVALSYLSEEPTLDGLKIANLKDAAESFDEAMKGVGHVLPSALYSYATAVNGAAREFAKAERECRDTAPYAINVYRAFSVWFIQSRRFLGADELSPITARLYGQDEMLDINNLEIDRNTEFGRFYSAGMGLGADAEEEEEP